MPIGDEGHVGTSLRLSLDPEVEEHLRFDVTELMIERESAEEEGDQVRQMDLINAHRFFDHLPIDDLVEAVAGRQRRSEAGAMSDR